MRSTWRLAAVAAAAACLPEPKADLVGPRVVAANWPAFAVQVPVAPVVEVELSEPPDLETLSPRHIAWVRWEEVGRCDLTPVCGKGSCRAGRCWTDPLSSSDLNALDRGEYEGELELVAPLEFELDAAPGGPERLLRIRPGVTLEAYARYSVVIGAGLRDRSGAGLEDDAGRSARWRSELVTAGEGSAGPEPRLSSPLPGAAEVPTNVAAIETFFARPVVVVPAATLVLASEAGDSRVLSDPVSCEGWAPGHCLVWANREALAPETSYAVVGGSLADERGYQVVPPHGPESFLTGTGPDLDPPELEDLELAVRGPCAVVRAFTQEEVRVSLTIGGATVHAQGSGAIELALRLPPDPNGLIADLVASDLAGNQIASEHALEQAPSAESVPMLAITEVLANPFGPEPHQEVVEVVNIGTSEVDLGGSRLVDLTWESVEPTLVGSGEPLGDPLPATTLAPGQIALVVAAGYGPTEGSDPAPPATAALLRVDVSLGAGGLKNAGEPLTLYRADPPALLASYGNFIDSSATSHAGRSVVLARPDACDVASSWLSHPLGRSTPGRLP